MQSIAIIPARGGSKRIPKKNIRLFCSKPIIYYSIQAAIDSRVFDRVIVSTDDQEIADISNNFGASIQSLRPKSIADDKSGVFEVVAHELQELLKQGESPPDVCLIYATAPLIRVEDLRASYKLFKKCQKKFVFSVAEYPSPISRAFTIRTDGSVKMFQPEFYLANSQDLPRAFYDAGQFCWGEAKAILCPDAMVFSEDSLAYVLPTNRVVDINTIDDWNHAEWMYKAHRFLSNSD